jgi:hypothetical protein
LKDAWRRLGKEEEVEEIEERKMKVDARRVLCGCIGAGDCDSDT